MNKKIIVGIVVIISLILVIGLIFAIKDKFKTQDVITIEKVVCENDFETNRGVINNLIYSLNNPQNQPNKPRILEEKEQLYKLTVCVLSQQNSTHKIIGLENITEELYNREIEMSTPPTDKIKYPELVITE